MIGIEAIEAYNGWAMALNGASIVFIGLVLLSFAVSRLHRILGFWERRSGRSPQASSEGSGNSSLDPGFGNPSLPSEIAAGVQQLRLLSERIGDPFSLPRVLDLAQKAGMLQSHSVANHALASGMLAPDGKGYFSWKRSPSS